jgi:type VI secretion system protein ImpH
MGDTGRASSDALSAGAGARAGEGSARGRSLAVLLSMLARPRGHKGQDGGGKPYEFDFFHAVRCLECAEPGMPRVGTSRLLDRREETVLFGQDPSTKFAPRTIDGGETCERTGWTRLYVNFLGLLGPNGPMPLHLTEHARERLLHHKDPTTARFFDVFNHRMIALFYRAWAVNQLPASYDRAGRERDQGEGFARRDEDSFARFLRSFAGINAPGLRDRDSVPDTARVYFSGRLVSNTRTPEGLAAVVGGYFGVRARVEEFVGRWVLLPTQYRCVLGGPASSRTLGTSPESGGTAFAGERVWDCQSTIRLRLGPMGLADYERFLPLHRIGEAGGRTVRRLDAWLRTYLGDETACDVQLVLKRDEVPEVKLGHGARLGWTTWLTTGPVDRDRDDVVLRAGA